MVLAAFALACCVSAHGLDPSLDISQYAHTSWKVRDGFTKGVIVALAQGSDGYLWLGTEFGLVRFDGVRAVPWQPPAGQQLPRDNIQSLLFARDGTLWIAPWEALRVGKTGSSPMTPKWRDSKSFRCSRTAGAQSGPAVSGLAAKRSSAPPGTRRICQDGDGRLRDGTFGLYEDTL
jgi:hypothetical protein